MSTTKCFVVQSEAKPQPNTEAVEEAIPSRHPKNMSRLKPFFKEDRCRIPECCACLIHSYKKQFNQLLEHCCYYISTITLYIQ